MNIGIVSITGAAGFIGGNLQDMLESRHVQAYGIDSRRNRAYGTLPNIHKTFDLAVDGFFNDAWVRDPDVIVHLAGKGGVRSSFDDTPESILDNVEATCRLFDTIASFREDNPPRVIVASSSSVYGDSMSGTAAASESQPLKPISPYGHAKAAVEHVCDAYRHVIPELCVIRPFTVYGPRGRGDMFVSRAIGSALNSHVMPLVSDLDLTFRTFTYVDDVCNAIVGLCEVESLPSVVNVCHDFTHSLREVVHWIDLITDSTVQFDERSAEYPEPSVTRGDNSLLQETLPGWKTTSLSTGIRKTVDWWTTR